MGINRIKLQAGSSAEMAAAEKIKTSDPALDAIRQQLFGQNYIQDIGRGQGIAQYYSNFGLPSSLQFTQPAASTPAVDTSTPVVDTGSGGGGAASVIQPITPSTGINTSEEQRLIDEGIGVQIAPGQPVVAPGEMPVTQEEMDAFNKIPARTILPETVAPSGDVFAPGDYTDVAGTLADPTEKIDYTQDPEGFGNRVKTALSEGKDLVTEFGQGVSDQISKLKDQGIDLGKMAGRAIANAVIPGLGFALDVLPERDPRQNKLDDLYDVKDGTIQSGLMKGYNPVSGNPLDPTYGLQNAYQKRIDTINETLTKQGDSPSQELINRRNALIEAKNKEASILTSPSVDSGRGSGLRTGEIKAATGEDFGVEVGPDITGIAGPPSQISGPQVTEVNPFADIDTGVGEFDIMGTEPTLQEVAAANNINIAEGIPTYETLPEGASKTGTPIDSLNPINRQQHFNNTQKLKNAVTDGEITNEEYNVLSAFDARKTMGLGVVTGTLASGAYQGIQTAAGVGKKLFGLDRAYAGDQSVEEAIDDTARNIQGVSGNVSPELQVKYQEIVSGQDIYRDPILGMVEEPEVGTLAGDYGDAFEDYDIDISQDAPSIIDDEDDFEVSGDIAPGGMDQVLGKPVDTSPPTGTDRPGGDRRDDSPSDIPDRGRGQTPSKAPSAPTGISGPPSRGGSSGGPPSQGGGNQGGGNSKIVCTMMNESYGFGSFRNKIWMKFHKDLSPEYQEGYHKLFLPLVKIAKTNKVVKKILEHIAVHSTIDMRQATRGKKHLLGRMYRKIILPVCYVVGKYAKR